MGSQPIDLQSLFDRVAVWTLRRRPTRAGSLAGVLAVLAALGAATLGAASPARADLEHDAPAGACGVDAVDHGTPRVRACLVADAEAVRAGDAVRVGVRLRMSPRWHVYWTNPGQGALATEATFDATGARVDAIEWPVPVRIVRADGLITLYGYENEVTLWTTAHVDARATAATVRAVVDFLVCDVDCIPGRIALTRALPIGDATRPSADAEVRAAFDAAVPRSPRAPADVGATVRVRLDPPRVAPGDAFDAAIDVDVGAPLDAPDQGVASAYFPELVRGVEWTARAVDATPRGAVVHVHGGAGPDDPGADQRADGDVALRRADGTPVYLRVAFPLPRTRASVGGAAHGHATRADATRGGAAGSVAMRGDAMDGDGASGSDADGDAAAVPEIGLGLALLFALLGGLVLNLMPCVLPVLLVKAASFARVAGEPVRVRALHVVAYAVGVEATMLALAAVVVALRSAGVAVGWGFQFQEPAFLAGASALLVVLALGLFGVYALVPPLASEAAARVDAVRAGLGRSAAEGALAVLLATPCSAPLLGTAVGFALLGSPTRIALVFAAIGVGLALPFSLVALVPGARRLVPRPGAWTIALERVLGFALLATVVWLAWVLGQVAGVDAVGRLLGFLVATSAAVWTIAATRGAASRGVRTAGLVLPLALLPVIGAHVLQFGPPPAGPVDAAGAWSDAAVSRALASGRPVLVDFTADWCITCKVNERTVLSSAEVRDAVRDARAVVLRADWTRRDESIRRVLAAHGKAGVPMYLVYAPSAPQRPEVLPEVLTPGLVADALRRAVPH